MEKESATPFRFLPFLCRVYNVGTEETKMENKKTGRVVLITGESSGFGLEMAKLFLKNKDIVCGFSNQQFEMEGIYHQYGDISCPEDCKKAVDNIIEKYGRIDVLMNNAGFGIFGPFEETPIEKAKKQVDVSFFGAFLMTQAVLPYMRKQKEGKIINTSSIGGIIPLPFQGFYSASKAAMDMLFDSLRPEVYPYHIQICSIKPGDAKTNFTKNREKDRLDEKSPYRDAFDHCLKSVSKDEQGGIEPIRIAEKAFRISLKKNMPYTRSIGAKDRFLSGIYHLLPRRARNYLLYKVYAC